MAICKFWLQDKCRFGISCRYDHPSKGQNASPARGSSFGAPSPQRGNSGVFARPTQPASFGQSSGPATSNSTGAFGRPSVPASNGFGGSQSISSGSFAAPVQSAAGNAFGQGARRAGFGQPSFDQTSQRMTQGGASGGGGFGQSSFGQTSQANGSAFGQSANRPSFGATGFGQASQPSPASNTFGPSNSATGFGGNTTFGSMNGTGFGPNAGAFGAASQQSISGAVGQTMDVSMDTDMDSKPGSAFAMNNTGPKSPFGASSQPGFGFASHAPPAASFGMTQNGTNSTQQNQNTDSAHGPYPPGSSLQHPDVSSYSVRDASGILSSWKGRPVQYVNENPCVQRDDDGSWERIVFPNGPPAYTKDTQLPESKYNGKTKEAYLFLRDNGYFKDGWMPNLPPRREWCRWDF